MPRYAGRMNLSCCFVFLSRTNMSNNPVEIDLENKIKINPESMIIEKLYPIIYDNSVYLFFKDENELINCYEITDKNIIEKAQLNPDKIIEILEELDN